MPGRESRNLAHIFSCISVVVREGRGAAGRAAILKAFSKNYDNFQFAILQQMKIERDSFLFATDFEWKDRGAENRERERERTMDEGINNEKKNKGGGGTFSENESSFRLVHRQRLELGFLQFLSHPIPPTYYAQNIICHLPDFSILERFLESIKYSIPSLVHSLTQSHN